ncbi:hypothetical protein HK096_004891, partial [Nowakowskiella sp. JEL0078]
MRKDMRMLALLFSGKLPLEILSLILEDLPPLCWNCLKFHFPSSIPPWFDIVEGSWTGEVLIFREWGENVPILSALQNTGLPGCGLSLFPSDFSFLQEALSHNCLLKFLVNYTEIGLKGAEAISRALLLNSSLRILDLSRNKLRNDGSILLANSLKVNKTIQAIDLSENAIGTTGVVLISEMLKQNTTLLSLELSGNNFGKIGINAVCSALKVNCVLSCLWLSVNKIGTEGALIIEVALRINTG